MTDVRAVSLHQPWASLIALGVKQVETRSWPTTYRGRLLIHAAKRTQYGPCGGGYAVKRHVNDDPILVHPHSAMGRHETRLPLGAVVASCVLTDCVPMAAGHPEEQPWHGVSIYPNGDLFVNHWNEHGQGGGYEVTDQAPFGDFSPGRFAWLLDDVKPTTERCPRCWGSGTAQILDGDEGLDLGALDRCCTTCRGMGHGVEPVPMRGRQGLWRPSW